MNAILILISAMLTILAAGSVKNDPDEKYPKDYFTSPVNHKILLSGTFGELRSNHFHSGIDIKPSNGGPGDPILAAAEGEVVRISVSPGGFGNALYLQHPNGYVTVYAHLDRFIPEISRYVKKMQYDKKSFALNLYPQKQFMFTQGETIGYMGNSGSSTGVHLHFEIRKSSKPINPLYFGLELQDQIKPKINQLVIYELAENTTAIDQKHISTPWSELDTIVVNSNSIGVGIQTYDMMNHLHNKNGVYNIQLLVDDKQQFNIEFESFSFGETRYLNAHTDYPAYQQTRKRIHRLYNLPGNRFSLCKHQDQQGIIQINNEQTKEIKVIVQDYNQNKRILQFTLKGDEIKQRIPTAQSSEVFRFDRENRYETNHFELVMPPYTLYEDLFFHCLEVEERSDGMFSYTYLLNEKPIAIHKYYDIKIKPRSPVLNMYPGKAFIADCSGSGELVSYGGNTEGGFLKAQVRSLGKFTVMIDTIAPTIQTINFSGDMRGAKSMSFIIKDNVEVAGKAKGLTYHASVDGQWILFEYDAKKDKIFHTFDDRIKPGEHKLNITVVDDRKNTARFTGTFTR